MLENVTYVNSLLINCDTGILFTDWFAQRVEQLAKEKLDNDYKVKIALEMAKSQNFDHFLAKKFQTVKRYGGEGCESMMAFFLELVKSSRKSTKCYVWNCIIY